MPIELMASTNDLISSLEQYSKSYESWIKSGAVKNHEKFCRRSLNRQKKKTPPAEADEVPTMKKMNYSVESDSRCPSTFKKNLTSNKGKRYRNSPSYWF